MSLPVPNRIAVGKRSSQRKSTAVETERTESSPRNRCMRPIHDGEEDNEDLVELSIIWK